MTAETQALAPRESFDTALPEAMRTARRDRPATWTHPERDLTVRVTGHLRPNPTHWPQPTARVIITTPTGETEIDGDDIGSWDALWDAIEQAEAEDSLLTEQASLDLRGHARRLAEAESLARSRVAERDSAIRKALGLGIPVPVVAEQSGVSVPRVYQIKDGRR